MQPSHKEILACSRRLTRQLSKLLETIGISSDFERRELVLAIVGLACLARRRIYPSWLRQHGAYKLLSRLAQAPDLKEDPTAFGQRLSAILLPAARLAALEQDLEPICTMLTHPLLLPYFDQPVFPGWVFQSLYRRSRSSVTNVSPEFDPQSASGKNMKPEDLPVLTQWFTPQWITSFLVQETIGALLPDPSLDRYEHNAAAPFTAQTTSIRFLDPACGAGHILVEALATLVANRSSNETAHEALTRALQNQVFGCDLDRSVIELAAFSIYLASRDIASDCNLPLPNLFHFGPIADDDTTAMGSLWLGVKSIPDSIMAYDLSGQAVPLAAHPLAESFNAIATNPPYLSHRLMPPQLSSFIKRHYHSGRFDLYAAFMTLCSRLLTDGGRMGLICQQSFMSIQRYEALRTELQQSCRIETLAQLGSGSFGSITGDKVNNALIIAVASQAGIAEQHEISCRRITTAQEKSKAEQFGIAALKAVQIKPSALAAISGTPLSFWCSEELSALFQLHPPLESNDTGITCTNGLFTCNNRRFVKLRRQLAPHEVHDYVPYDKGGGHKWYHTTPYAIYWADSGNSVREYRVRQGQSASLPGEKHYFKDGLTYSYIGTRGFKARLLSPGCVFDIASSAIISSKIELLYLLGFLNSSLARFLLGVLNPTINFQIGDLRRLPFILPPRDVATIVIKAAAEAVEVAREIDTFIPSSPAYAGPPLLRYGSNLDPESSYLEHLDHINALNQTEANCQSTIDDQIFEFYKISSQARETINTDPWVTAGNKLLYSAPSFADQLKLLSAGSN